MKFNTKLILFVMSLLISVLSDAQTQSQSYIAYINQYYQLAVRQQKEHGIPSSIILAQGLLESGAGISDFAKQSNNHFGIKCNDWNGARIYHDDDAKGECFRKYDKVIDSYEDHALFLKNRPRYAFLFNLSPTDYEAWAHGLKKAGYATDPTYDYKLISIIENYNLHQFDLGINNNNSLNKNNIDGSMGSVSASMNHSLAKVNNVKFVTSYAGDSYAQIADEFKITLNRICEYNEVDPNTPLSEGTRVFIEGKKNKACRECETHVVQEGESMYSISQDYAIKVVKLYELNNMPFTDGVYIGQTLKLR